MKGILKAKRMGNNCGHGIEMESLGKWFCLFIYLFFFFFFYANRMSESEATRWLGLLLRPLIYIQLKGQIEGSFPFNTWLEFIYWVDGELRNSAFRELFANKESTSMREKSCHLSAISFSPCPPLCGMQVYLRSWTAEKQCKLCNWNCYSLYGLLF